MATIYLFPLSAHAEDKVTIFAASSLTAVLNDSFKEASFEGLSVDISYAGSGTIARQIEAGAPADIFISANAIWMDHLSDKGLLEEQNRAAFALNDLALVAPARSRLPDLAPYHLLQHKDVRRIAIGETASVPAGIYGREMLEKYDLWHTLKPKLLPADSVRNVLSWVERGEADLAFVYQSDAEASRKVKIKHIFRPSHRGGINAAVYSCAIIAGRKSKGVVTVYDFLLSTTVKDILRQHGLRLPTDVAPPYKPAHADTN